MEIEKFMNVFFVLLLFVIAIGLVIVVVISWYEKDSMGFDSIENKRINDCKEICNSNSLVYYKITNSGYSGLTRICYCKDLDGKISTRIL